MSNLFTSMKDKLLSLSALFVLINLLALVTAVLPWGAVLTPLLLFISLVVMAHVIPITMGRHRAYFGQLVVLSVGNVLLSIVAYALVFQRSGLIIGGELVQQVDLATALYFSGTTWTTVGYGDISAPMNFRLLTTVEALNSYFAMALFVALIVQWIERKIEQAKKRRRKSAK